MADREFVKAVTITDTKTGEQFILDFNREAVAFAENRGFKVEDLGNYPATKVPEFFFYAFRAHHKNVARNKTDALLEAMGGMTTALIERLMALYAQAGYINIIADEDSEKNATVTVEL